MALIASLYDVCSRINMPYLRREFPSLQRDPYVDSGFRYKHIARFKYDRERGFRKLPQTPLYQSANYNPTHGDIYREYPEIVPKTPIVLLQTLQAFTKVADVPSGETILIQYQRITCDPDKTGLPAVEGWHQDDVTKVGVICVDRHNIKGGETHIKSSNANYSAADSVLSFELLPGYMVLFEDDKVMHYVTPISSADGTNPGYRDVVLLSYGGSSS